MKHYGSTLQNRIYAPANLLVLPGHFLFEIYGIGTLGLPNPRGSCEALPPHELGKLPPFRQSGVAHSLGGALP